MALISGSVVAGSLKIITKNKIDSGTKTNEATLKVIILNNLGALGDIA